MSSEAVQAEQAAFKRLVTSSGALDALGEAAGDDVQLKQSLGIYTTPSDNSAHSVFEAIIPAEKLVPGALFVFDVLALKTGALGNSSLWLEVEVDENTSESLSSVAQAADTVRINTTFKVKVLDDGDGDVFLVCFNDDPAQGDNATLGGTTVTVADYAETGLKLSLRYQSTTEDEGLNVYHAGVTITQAAVIEDMSQA